MKIFVMFVAVLVLLCGPMVAQGNAPPLIDVQHYEIQAQVVPEESLLKGQAKIRFTVLEDTLSLPFELNNRLSLLEVNDEENFQLSWLFNDFDSSRLRVRGPKLFAKGTEKTLTFDFEGVIEGQGYAFLDIPQTERVVIYPEGALLLSEGKWFPSYGLPFDAATLTLRMTVPLGFTAVGPGILESIQTLGISEVFTWSSTSPLTCFPVVVERFFRQQYDKPPLPLTFYVTEDFEGDLSHFADEVGKMLEFFQEEYGPYHGTALNFVWVGNVELPSTGSSQLILLDSKILDSPSPRIMDLARRIAHQWWGDSVRLRTSSDAWLADGFAAYAALRYVQEKYPGQFALQLARQAVQTLKYESQAPISRGLQLDSGSPEYESIVSSKSAWVLYMLSQLVEPEKLNLMLRDWYREKSGQAVATAEWVDFVEQQTGKDYSWFFVQWVDQVGVPEFLVDYTIYKLKEGGFKISGQVKQNLELFRMPLDLIIRTKGQPEEKQLRVSGKSTSFTFHTETLPLKIDFDPHGKVLSQSSRMQISVHIALGEEHQELGDFVGAIREYEKASKLNPRSSLAHYRLGEIFFEQQNLSSASNSFRDSLNGDLKPKWVETWTHIFLGKIYDILGQRQRAMAEYQKAINTKNDHNSALDEAEKYRKEAYAKPTSLIG